MLYLTSDYLLSAFIRLYLHRIHSIHDKYRTLPGMKRVTGYLKEDSGRTLQEVWGPPFDSLADETDRKRDKAGETLDTLKHSVEPADYLFLKAGLCVELKDARHYCGMAQAIEPYNAFLYVFMNVDLEGNDIGREMYHAVKRCPVKPADAETTKFFKTVNLIGTILHTTERIPVPELKSMIKSDPGFAQMLYSVFYECKDTRDPEELLRVTEALNFPSIVIWNEFERLKSFFLFRLAKYTQAFDAYKKSNPILMVEWERLEYSCLLAKLYHHCGQDGKAILLAKEIVEDEDYRGMGHDAYYNLVLFLSGLYIQHGQYKEAREILLADRFTLSCLLDVQKAGFLRIHGDLCVADKRISKAIRLYKRSLSLAGDKELEEKVMLLEKDLC